MESNVISTTVQAVGFSVLSNIIAQVFSAYQTDKPLSLDFTIIFQFILWTIISCPPNVYWQDFLESKYPSETPDEKGQKKLNKANTFKKFILDQTIGAIANNAGYIAGMSAIKGKDSSEISFALRHDLWPILTSSWKLWPMVSLINFTVMPPNKRMLFGSLVGLCWGVYICLITV